MAPVLEKQLPGAAGTGDNNNEDEEGQNLWQVSLHDTAAVMSPHARGEADPLRWFCFVTAGVSVKKDTGPASSGVSTE
ncbi:hypothetical protein D9C73_004330 [Collichthys lucidus]|uniref:Uncharacterized protein n=1 Tax=Collichthys lucidus TaxID=240159 RepID=A0A4V6AMW7_COLLU|nr:hypothetical protein D9C73_004330 [Collichthys lucidus]